MHAESNAARPCYLTATALSVVLLCTALSEAAMGQARPVNAIGPARASTGAANAADRRDALLLLDDAPIHLRLHLAIGGVSLREARQQFVSRLMERLDTDKDGKVARQEASRSPLLRTKQRPSASEFLEKLKAQTHLTHRDVTQTVDRVAGELIAYRQDLTSSQYDVEVFKLFDQDSSGTLTLDELKAAADLIISKDGDGDECVAFQEFFPPAPPPDPLMISLGPTTPTPLATKADMIRDASEPTIARGLLRKYDRNRDLQLDTKEIGWSQQRLNVLDEDGNGRLDAAELLALGHADPDIEMQVDLTGTASDGRLINVVATGGRRMDDGSRGDFAKVGFRGAVVTFSHRNVDPTAAAIDSAMRQFNQLDADANGYLGRDETMERIRFERSLFDMMDADGDDKLFADEMKRYVQAHSEPAGATCRLNVYDTGYGFFMALDGNADGRVSERERRKAAVSLAQLDRDGQRGVGQNEPVRHFHIEFARGSYQLFGPSEQLVAQTPAFQRRQPGGPIWFQRMDRNNDGDLTWNEFLGPREIFHKLDADSDSLIDPQEAAKAR